LSIVATGGPLSRANRGIATALALSLAAHLLVLTLTPKPRFDPIGPMDEREPLRVEIVTRAPQAEVVPAPTPAPPQVRPQPVPRPPPRTVRPAPVPAPRVPQPTPEPPKPAPEIAPAPRAPAFDMAAMIEARRQRRLAAEAAAARGAPPPEPGVQSQDPAVASLNRNLQSLRGREGVGGIFQILHMGTRTGEFAFNGWRPDSQRQWREVIEVDAGPGGNLELAMVRRMIELIRTHYTGDFNWESHRLQRTVVLSARPEDSSGLEDFLMREFFDTPLPRK
jgi:outer membrane biosynthesis protein TonB